MINLNKYKRILFLTSVLILGVFLLWRFINNIGISESSLNNNFNKLYLESKNIVANISYIDSNNKKISWTGFLVSRDWFFSNIHSKQRYILTNKHILDFKKLSKIYNIKINNKNYKAKLRLLDNIYDLAILEIIDLDDKTKLKTFARFKDKDNNKNLRVWEEVYSIWNLYWEYDNSLSKWIISWIKRSVNTIEYNFIETDLNLWEWESWSPLFNKYWKIIWINTLILDNTSKSSFAIKLDKNIINYYLYKIFKFPLDNPNILEKWILDLEYKYIDNNLKNNLDLNLDYGIYILEDHKNSLDLNLDKKIVIKKWDIIYEINNLSELKWKKIYHKVYNKNLYDILRFNKKWDIIKLKILRWNEELDLEYTLK